ncbi:MAG: hypothetical protein ACP5VE_12290 [Chthonomonadales bacterium]
MRFKFPRVRWIAFHADEENAPQEPADEILSLIQAAAHRHDMGDLEGAMAGYERAARELDARWDRLDRVDRHNCSVVYMLWGWAMMQKAQALRRAARRHLRDAIKRNPWSARAWWHLLLSRM